MANTIVTSTMVAREANRQLYNNLNVGRCVFRGHEDEWKQKPNGWNIGDAVNIKMPVYFRVKDGASVDVVDLYETNTSITVDQHKHVAWKPTIKQMTLDIDKMSKRYLTPAAMALGNKIELDVLGMYTDVPAQVGTPGTTPNQFSTFADARAVLMREACPEDDLHLFVNSATVAKMTDHLKPLNHEQIVGDIIRKGKLAAPFAGFRDVYESQCLPTHTNGTWASGITVQKDGTSSEGDTTLAIKSDGTNQTAKHGDIFTCGDVYQNNPIHGASTGELRQFVVDADASMDGSGEIAALTCTPGSSPRAIYSESASETYLPYQNVYGLPTANDAITISGTTGEVYAINMGFHTDAFALVCVPLAVPASANWAASSTYKGFGMSVLRYLDGDTHSETIRFDVLYGIKAINPHLAVRIAGA